MHTTNYTDTLILPAADCPSPVAKVPDRPGSLAALQHERLASAPGQMTSDDLLFAVEAARKALDPADPVARAAFFGRAQACLRASPLVKVFGWALHHDDASRVTLVDPASPDFARLRADPGITQRPGMRNARA